MDSPRSQVLRCFWSLFLLSFASSTALYSQNAVTNDSIPDSAAYRLVFLSLFPPPAPTLTDIAKRELRLQRVGLASADANTIRPLLDSFSFDYANWQATLGSQDPSIIEGDRNKLINSFLLRIEQKLSSDGVTQFKQYVQGEKSKMSGSQ
jgi:hypothetical protein